MLEWLGLHQGKEIAVHCKRTGAIWVLTPEAIGTHGWEMLSGVMTGRRGPVVIKHFSRIVGYYSVIQNWNRSKIAELRDRQKGNYNFGAADFA